MPYDTKPKHRTLLALAKTINALKCGYTASVTQSHSSTDRKISGSRLSWRGQGRKGNRLVVIESNTGNVVIDHDTSETYRQVYEAEDLAVKIIGKRVLGYMPDRKR